MLSNDASAFDPEKYSPEATLLQIREIREHIKNDMTPKAALCSDVIFVNSFISYLDTLASRFELCLNAPLDLLAFVAQNLLEFSILLPVIFESSINRANFMNEAFRLDLHDLQTKLDATFAKAEAGTPSTEIEDALHWLPHSKIRLIGNREAFDSWFHKFCSKVMHPSAIMILAPEALTDPNKRITFCFASLQYLGKSYNFLSGVLFKETSNVSDA